MRQLIICTVIFLMALGLAACDASTQGPTAWLDRPLDGDRVPIEPLTIQAHASDADGVARFEFFVGDALLAQVPGSGGRFANAQAGWSPSAAGDYEVRARAVDGQGNVGPEAVARIVVGEVVQTPDTPTPTAAPPPASTDTPSPAPASGQCTADALVAPVLISPADGASIEGEPLLAWSYPDTACHPYSYAIDISENVSFTDIGWGFATLNHNETSRQWPLPPGQCYYWRARAYVPDVNGPPSQPWKFCIASTETATVEVPTYTPTSTPKPPTPTYTPTPTNTPTAPPPPPPPPADIQFWADNDNIPAGSCTTVHWHVANVKAYWVDGRPGSGDNGSFQTCPCQEERHTLHVVKPDNSEQDLEVTIRVSGECAAPPPPPPPPPQDTEGPSINDIELEKVNCDLYRGYATISDPSGVSWVQFRYKIGEGAWQSVGMSDIGGGYYETNDIGVSGEGIVNMEYYVVAGDTPGNQRESGHTAELVGCLE